MNILITGSTGFIGINLVKRLTEEGHFCRCLVRKNSVIDPLKHLSNIELFYGDVTDKKSLENVFDNISVVYHLAAIMGHDLPSESAFRKFRRVNTEGTRNIAECCVGKGVKKFIYVSSIAAMGLLRKKVVNEETLCKPFTPYQVSKYESELIVKELTEKKGLPGIILRPTRIYGPGFKGDLLTISKVVKTGIFPKIGLGKNLSPSLYIDDLSDCICKVKDKGAIGETYIISSEESYELEKVARIIARALNIKIRMIFIPKSLAIFGAWVLERIFLLFGKTPIATARNIHSSTTDRVFDVSKAKKELGYKQNISIEKGLKKTVEYFKSVGYL